MWLKRAESSATSTEIYVKRGIEFLSVFTAAAGENGRRKVDSRKTV